MDAFWIISIIMFVLWIIYKFAIEPAAKADEAQKKEKIEEALNNLFFGSLKIENTSLSPERVFVDEKEIGWIQPGFVFEGKYRAGQILQITVQNTQGQPWSREKVVVAAGQCYTLTINQRNQHASPKSDSSINSVPPDKRSPFQILGVATDASEEEITLAFRKLAQMYHPDKVAGLAPEYRQIAEQKMTEINSAYEEIRHRKGKAPSTSRKPQSSANSSKRTEPKADWSTQPPQSWLENGKAIINTDYHLKEGWVATRQNIYHLLAESGGARSGSFESLASQGLIFNILSKTKIKILASYKIGYYKILVVDGTNEGRKGYVAWNKIIE